MSSLLLGLPKHGVTLEPIKKQITYLEKELEEVYLNLLLVEFMEQIKTVV